MGQRALHPKAERIVRRALSVGPVDPVTDFAAIAELDRLAREQFEPRPEERLVFLDLPVIVADVHLYRLSWGALDWLCECGLPWFSKDQRFYARVEVWAFAHARSPDVFRAASSPQAARAAVTTWSRNVRAPFADLIRAADAMLGEPKGGGTSTADPNAPAAPLLRELMGEYGHDLDYWIWGLSAEALKSIIEAHCRRRDAQNAAASAAAYRPPAPSEAEAERTLEFQRAARAFVDLVAGRKQTAV
jgi:hypothetical protein